MRLANDSKSVEYTILFGKDIGTVNVYAPAKEPPELQNEAFELK
jgi:hypothetical protein